MTVDPAHLRALRRHARGILAVVDEIEKSIGYTDTVDEQPPSPPREARQAPSSRRP